MNDAPPLALKLKTAALRTAARTWLVYCSVAFLGAVAFIILDGDNPLRSDDPYIAGFVFGTIAACHSLFYSVAEAISRNKRLANVVWLVAMVLWCGLLGAAWYDALDSQDGVGQVFRLMFVGSLVAAAVEWPLLFFSIPRAVYAAMSAIGIVQIGLYLYVAVKVLA